MYQTVRKNDRNGNPRRVYVLLGDDGGIVNAFDEGYAGVDAIPLGVHLQLGQITDFDTTPAEYRLLREYGN